MQNKNKIMTFLALTAGGTSTIALLNKYIKINATKRNLTYEPESLCFKWRLGNIHYTKRGSGKPLLLVHDLNYASSGYEWNQIVEPLSRHHTVYTIDLLGCGRSEKPNLTYTNYLFVQLICDFIKSEIGHRTNVIVSGDSSSLIIMACNNDPDLFNQIILVNPDSMSGCSLIPGKNAKLYKYLLDFPIIGSLLYHIASSRMMLDELFKSKYYYNPYSVKQSLIECYYESAHLGKYPKALFSSIECSYTKCRITNALKDIDNSIFMISGSEEPGIKDTIIDYKRYNQAIESVMIPKTKHLPHQENPQAFLESVSMFIS